MTPSVPALPRALALLLIPACLLVFAACDSNDDSASDENVISTVNLTFTPRAGGNGITFIANFNDAGVLQDATNIILDANTTYTVSIELLNTFVTPAEDVTVEVRDNEPEKYRFFYTPGGGAARRLMVSDLDLDREGDELGATFAVTVSDGSTTTGTFRVKLRNYLDPDTLPEAKRDDTATAPEVPGVVGNDLNFTFPVTIQ
ncbi:MAG: hypothetical protein AAFX41_17555 [Bacteroidota bacterium]